MQEESRHKHGGCTDGESGADRDNSMVHRITSLDRQYNQREVIAGLIRKISDLEEKRQRLELTEAWLHQAIWDLMKREKELSGNIDRSGDEE